ncbi:MAG: contractile injection system protein, VgrG/Pvc8 family [Oscillospiraceae bacterium]
MGNLKQLEQDYNSFKNPVMYVKINGKKVKNTDLYFHTIEAVMGTGFEASVCRIEAEDISAKYENKKLTVDAQIEALFTVGTKLELYLGYDKKSSSKLVFMGFITTTAFELSVSNHVTYFVEAMDVKAFMMNNIRSELKKDMKKYSDVVTAVLNDYSTLFASKKIDNTDTIKTPIEQYNQSDYDFIVNIAKRVGYMFFVDRGKVNFIKYSSAKTKCLTVSPCGALKNFRRELSLNKQVKSVIVRSHDEANTDKPIEATAKSADTVGGGSKSAADLSKVISEKMSITIIDNSVRSPAEAQVRANAELTRQSMSLINGEITMFGVPDVFPGGILEVIEMPEDINGQYLITEVTHYLHDESYITTCRFGANKV